MFIIHTYKLLTIEFIMVFCHFTVLELYDCILIDAIEQKVFTAVIILKNMMFIVLIPKENATGYFFKIKLKF